MINPETHTCSTCGYVWKHGFDGSHDCSNLLCKRIQVLEDALQELLDFSVDDTHCRYAERSKLARQTAIEILRES